MKPDVSQISETGGLIPTENCPTCGYEMDSAIPLPGQGDCRPGVGDISVCLKCGEALEYTKEMRLRIATVDRLIELGPKAGNLMVEAQKLIRAKRFIK